MSKTAERKAKLHADLIDAAEARIAANGVGSLRTRDLAADVGCSLGSIYNVFSDLHAIVLHANFRTLNEIDEIMAEAVADELQEPVDCMVSLAHAYYDYALNNRNTWRGLFDHSFPAGQTLPDWIRVGQAQLLAYIEKPLSKALPNLDSAEISTVAQTLFSAAHGIIELSAEDRFVGLPPEQVKSQLRLLVCAYLEGYEQLAAKER